MATTSRTSDPRWDKDRQVWKCCGSAAAWRHKRGCAYNEGDGNLPPDDEPQPDVDARIKDEKLGL